MTFSNGAALLILMSFSFGLANYASGHGFAGARFFPATLSTDDPFVNDELSLPTVSTIETPDARETTLAVDLAKRITPNLGITIEEEFIDLNPTRDPETSGLGNIELGAKYQFFTSASHEAILSVGGSVEIGGTGQKKAGAESFSTWTAALFFGKGFGDLPGNVSILQPIAVTGFTGIAVPTSASTRVNDTEIERHPNVLQYGFALEYSLIYLQQQVNDIGLRAPLDHVIPLAEFSFSTPLNRRSSGETTGTINPGVIWSSKYAQFGVEAVIPINDRTGKSIGVIAQLHFYLDDLFSRNLGRPLITLR